MVLLREDKAVVASFLNNKAVCAIILGASGLQVGLSQMGLPAWECPFLDVTGCPCPGCGLTRAIMAMGRGDFQGMVEYHAFAPFFVLTFLLMGLIVVLPQGVSQKIIKGVEFYESRWQISVILLISFVLYWLGRLLFFQASFINLIQG